MDTLRYIGEDSVMVESRSLRCGGVSWSESYSGYSQDRWGDPQTRQSHESRLDVSRRLPLTWIWYAGSIKAIVREVIGDNPNTGERIVKTLVSYALK